MRNHLLLIDLDSINNSVLTAFSDDTLMPVRSWMITNLILRAIAKETPTDVVVISSEADVPEDLKKLNFSVVTHAPSMTDVESWTWLGYNSELLEIQMKPWMRCLEPNSSHTDVIAVTFDEVLARWGRNPDLIQDVWTVYQALKPLGKKRVTAINLCLKYSGIPAGEDLQNIRVKAIKAAITNLAPVRPPAAPLPKMTKISKETLSPLIADYASASICADHLASLEAKDYRTIDSYEELQTEVTKLEKADKLSIDTETTGLDVLNDRLVGISISASADSGIYIPVAVFDKSKLRKLLSKLFCSQSLKLMHNAAFDIEILQNNGFDINPPYYDTMLAAYVMCEPKVGLKDLAKKHLNSSMTTFEDLLGSSKSVEALPPAVVGDYACADADSTLGLFNILSPKIDAEPALRRVFSLEMSVLDIVRLMRHHGIRVDLGILGECQEVLAPQDPLIADDGLIVKALHETWRIAGREFNPDSPQQLNKLLFDEMDLPRTKKNKDSGLYSTDKIELGLINYAHPIIDAILTYRGLKTIQEHITRVINAVDPKTGRIHPDWKQATVVSGRLSSKPNLQNIPAPGEGVLGEMGYKIRSAFVPSTSDWRMAGADYSQLEARLLAHFSEDQGMIEGYERGDFDIHAYVASRIYGVDIEQVTPDQRRAAKPVVFGSAYGLTGYGYAKRSGKSKQEAEQFISAFFEEFDGLKRFQEQTIKSTRVSGYAETLIGRRRYQANINSHYDNVRAAAEREAINMPIQGSAADIVKLAMAEVVERVRTQGLRAIMLSQIHDELLLEVHPDDGQALLDILNEVMPNVVSLRVPLEVTAKIGASWAEVH